MIRLPEATVVSSHSAELTAFGLELAEVGRRGDELNARRDLAELRRLGVLGPERAAPGSSAPFYEAYRRWIASGFSATPATEVVLLHRPGESRTACDSRSSGRASGGVERGRRGCMWPESTMHGCTSTRTSLAQHAAREGSRPGRERSILRGASGGDRMARAAGQ